MKLHERDVTRGDISKKTVRIRVFVFETHVQYEQELLILGFLRVARLVGGGGGVAAAESTCGPKI